MHDNPINVMDKNPEGALREISRTDEEDNKGIGERSSNKLVKQHNESIKQHNEILKMLRTDNKNAKVTMFVADTEYPAVFHSPGLEPWVLGTLLRVKLNSMVDAGCGYGFWGFIAKRRVNSLSYVVGLF